MEFNDFCKDINCQIFNHSIDSCHYDYGGDCDFTAAEFNEWINTNDLEITQIQNIKVFLGGTCNESIWRDELISLIGFSNKLSLFNPVVEDWNQEAQEQEIQERENCDYCLYVITPKMLGTYSIAEVIDDSNKRPEKTLFCVLVEDDELVFNTSQLKSLIQVKRMVSTNGGKIFDGLDGIAAFLKCL